jgi:ABC-type glycerol-3-phosphate transport system permease component
VKAARAIFRAAILLAEMTVLAMVVIGVAVGRFDQAGGLLVYVFGALLALSVAVVAALPERAVGRILIHGALLVGCVVFSFPFVWLVSTSFKYREEIGVYPPKWVPSVPGCVTRSPHINDERIDPVRRPGDVPRARWRRLWPQLADAIWRRGRQLLGDRRAKGFPRAELEPALVRGLWHATWQSVPRELWAGDDAGVIDAVVGRVDRTRVDDVWDSIHYAVELRDVTVTDANSVQHALGPKGATLAQWRSRSGPAVKLGPPARAGAMPSRTVAYDFTETPTVSIAAVLPLPVKVADLLSITLPIRQDRSWHRMKVYVELGGRRYEPEDDFYLGRRRWQEITFQFKSKSTRDERNMGIWPIAGTAPGGAFNEPGRFRLTVELHRASAWSAGWRKYTDNYRVAAIVTEHRWRYVFNSFYLVVMNVVCQIFSCSLVAYAFARLRFPGRTALFTIMLATMMLPPQVTMIPVFGIFRRLGWYNTLKPLWVPSLFGSAFFIFMLRQFMRSIPRELEDAAKIDGCSFLGVYWRIILPLMKPALAAVAIFTFMGTWNNFMGPLIYLNDQRLYPLALGLFDFRTQHGGDYGLLMAASTMMTLPMIAVFFLAQKHFIQGVTLTGMKG